MCGRRLDGGPDRRLDRPRVVVLDHTADLGGAELALVRLLDAVSDSADVHVVLFADGPLVRLLEASGHRVDVLPLDPAVGGLGRAAAGSRAGAAAALRTLPFVVRLARLLRRHAPDVVHTTSLKADVLGSVAARLARRPLVWHVHDRLADDYLSPRVARLMRALARRVPDAVIANSHATARTIDPRWEPTDRGVGTGAPSGSRRGRRPLVVAHPGLSSDQVAAAPRGAPPEQRVVGIVGRISPTKDQLSFVRAAAALGPDLADVRFRIIGAPLFGHEAYAEQVRAEATRLGVADRLEWTGFVDDPAAALDQLTVCVHAAAVPEPFGQVVAEAMARGVAVVATAGGGVDEILRPDPDGPARGWLVPPRDPDALAAALREALTRPDEAAARARAGWESVRAGFDIATTAETVLGVWRQVAAAASRPARRSG